MAKRKPKKQPVISSMCAKLPGPGYRLYIRIEGDTPLATNQLLGAKGYWKKHNNAVKWKYVVGNAVELFLPESLLNHVHISAVRHAPRMLDYDGLVASLKPVIDGLKNLVIEDDDWKRTGPWKVGQQFRSSKEGPPMIELWITEKERPDDIDA